MGEENLQEYLGPRFADLNGLEWEGIYIENHENRFADMETREGSGCSVGPRASRLRGSRKAENK